VKIEVETIKIVAIPRFGSPEKPNLNLFRVNMLAINNPNSLCWPGRYAEAYWNFGWIGIPVLLISLGVIAF
jgi:hypothetical protein